MSQAKVILLCGGRLAIPILRILFFNKQLAVVAIPDHCTVFMQQVNLLLKGAAIPIVTVTKKDYTEQLQKAIKKYEANMGIMAAFSFKISPAVFCLTNKGFFNVHPGLLPQYRGPDPVFQQLKNKDTFAGITIHKVDKDFDTGHIVLTEKIKIQTTDTHGILTTRLSELAAKQVDILLKMATFDIDIPSRSQDESKAVYFKKQAATEVTINWKTMDAATIVALANACNPWNKGAVTQLNGIVVRLLGVEELTEQAQKENVPATILAIENGSITVATINTGLLAISIISVDEGILKASMLAKMGINVGMRFQ